MSDTVAVLLFVAFMQAVQLMYIRWIWLRTEYPQDRKFD